ncbi:MAG TPA: sigma-70 family RNA polymerase sigma factor [Gryllotalpicola sp.]
MSLNTSPRRDLSGLSDAELISRFRAGSSDAYGQLWERHLSAGIAAARAATSRIDPEDVVAEAFLRVMETLRRGKGPEFAFRPYLLTAVRNVASRSGKRQAKDVPLGELEFEDERFSEDVLDAALDGTLLTQGFASLPTRWQEVLWYLEVEGLTPREAAAMMGLRPAAVSSLAYRAREGLRVAWIKAHIASAPEGSECRWTIDHLPARERGTLKPAERERIEAHLASCERCPIAVESAQDASRRLGPAALTALLGAGGVGGYLEWFRQPAPASAATPPPLPVTEGAARGALVTGTQATLIAAAIAAAGALVVTGLLLRPDSAPRRAEPREVTSTTSPAAAESPTPTPTASSPRPSAGPSTPASAPASASASAPPSPSAETTSTPIAAAPAVPAAPSPRPTASAALPVPAPIVAATDTGGGRFYPVVSGRAAPGAHVTVVAGGTSYAATVTASGEWTSPALTGIPVGVTRISVTQTTSGTTSAATTTSVDLAAVSVQESGVAGDGRVTVAVSGVVGATVVLVTGAGDVTVALDATGSGMAELAPGTGSVAAYYSAAGRRGPASTVRLAAP